MSAQGKNAGVGLKGNEIQIKVSKVLVIAMV